MLGNLRQATLSDGKQVASLIGLTVRVEESARIQNFRYQGSLRPIAELDGGNPVFSRFVYAAGVNAPDCLVKGSCKLDS